MKQRITLLIVLFLALMPNVSAQETQKSIVFAIDISGSMKGTKLQTTKDSVIRVIQSLKSDKPVAIIKFNQDIEIVQTPTLNRNLIKQKTDELIANGETSLYDAVNFSINTKFPDGIDQIVLLSDGEDSTSRVNLESLIKDIKLNKIKINTIGIQISSAQKEILKNIAEASGGNFYNVQEISTLLDTYKVILEKEITNSNNSIAEQDRNLNNFQLIHFIFGFISFLMAIYFFLAIKNIYIDKKEKKSRLRNLVAYSRVGVKKSKDKVKLFLSTYNFVPNWLETKIKEELESIHSNLKYETIINFLLAGWILMTLTINIILQNLLFSIICSIPVVYFTFIASIRRIKSKRELEFDEHLPEMLNLLASALRSGLTLNQSLEAYSADANNEVSRQMRRAMSEVRLGSSIDEALMKVATRMKSEDLKWAVTALSIQKVVGGSMAGILSTTYETINSRTEIRREVRTLSSEGRLSAYILMALPIGMFFYLFLTRREYANLLFTNPIGILLSIISFVLLTVGWRWIKSIVNIKI